MYMDANSLFPGRLVRNRIEISSSRSDLTFPNFWGPLRTVPAKTLFKVRGVHTVEHWADIEAENLVSMKIRFTFEEIGRLFEFA
jgi:hypothetical protein